MRTIEGLQEALRRLERLAIPEALARECDAAAAGLQDAVATGLSQTPGSEHETPWLQSGALRASIECQSEGLTATIGSTSDVAVFQELGTVGVPPRSFLATTAAVEAEGVVARMAANLARWLAEH
jgi:phage gpG-like protein